MLRNTSREIMPLLCRHNRILVVRNSTFVMPNASDVFEACPETAQFCGAPEGLQPKREDQERCFNAGFFVIGRSAQRLLAQLVGALPTIPSRICVPLYISAHALPREFSHLLRGAVTGGRLPFANFYQLRGE